MTWTQPVCTECWWKENPDRPPMRLIIKQEERCCLCGDLTFSGIYVRKDPKEVKYPVLRED